MGGGSSINVQSANRGLPRDYDEWAANGAPGWAWNDVLPYFRKLERDVNFPRGELHGGDGPVPIRRIMPEDWPPFCHAFADGLRANGFATLQDQNAEFGDGLFPGAFSNSTTSACLPLSPISTKRHASGPISPCIRTCASSGS